MARLQTRYLCQNCGYESVKWMGKCPDCDAWDSFVEEVTVRAKPAAVSGGGIVPSSGAPVPITDVALADQERMSSGIGEFDRVLGGGFVPGGMVLMGGEPGIGKSTLCSQVAACVAAQGRVLYVSGEESAQQIRMRCARLRAESPNILISVETEIALVLRHLSETRPALAVIDSIQTMSDQSFESAPGSVTQVRACAVHLARFAKSSGVPVVLIGHVTKEGSIAGPRVLEHIVDTVLNFEGDRHHAYRLLRAAKNRFGSTDELGIFEMRESGLVGIENPSALLLAERSEGGPGSAVACTLEGSRALLVEVQALVARSPLASPRRAVTGMDPNRVNMLLAVLEKRVGLRLAEQDVFVNVAGGIRILEPAADLATAMAVASSFREQPVDPATILIGEVGLAGEVRAVTQVEKRLREAARQGFTRAVLSRHNVAGVPAIAGLEVVGVASVQEALQTALLPPSSAAR
ncbi:MAG: DNA repair protein RadA [Chloroherpetonaceae bacterium]|nr:DNA repair protein RadA [Chthonomonadaceae bacterium]MDW8206348.1 DNA repair protein RadA [Chloroherpetonaceae bacterium]